MFQTQRMTKIHIAGPQTQLETVIRVLHRLRLVHLLDHIKTEEIDIGRPLGASEDIAALLVKTKALAAWFGVAEDQKETVSDTLETMTKRIDAIAKKYAETDNKISEINTLLAEKKTVLEQLSVLEVLGLDATALRQYRYMSLLIGTVENIDGLEKALTNVTTKMSFHSSIYKNQNIVVVLVPKEFRAKIEEALHTHSFQAITFANLSSWKGKSSENIRQGRMIIDLLEKDHAELVAEQENFVGKHRGFLAGAIDFLEKEAEKAQAPLRFAETKYAFLIQGWVSTRAYYQVKKELEKETNNKVFIDVLSVQTKEKTPIIMKNMFFVKPFEFFMHLYTLPSYKEMDPSFFLFITFPFFFGLMLGDVIYGVITLLLFSLLWWKIPKARNIATAMMMCSIVTIFFGFLFGEYLGFEYVSTETGKSLLQLGIPLHEEVVHGHAVYSFPRVLNRLHSTMTVGGNHLPTVLVIGALLGFLHVNLGLFLGCINEVVQKGLKHAFFAKISWYVLELGVALSVLSWLGMIPFHWGVGVGVMGIAAVMLFIGEGVQGIVEIPAILTNILSYLRLGAVALASVGLAVVVNEKLALPFIEQGGMYAIVGIVILILGHTINIALGVIGPFLHALRLHYVEFFSKFYHGGGIPFVAFGGEKER